VLEGDRQIPVQTPRLGANFVPQSRDLAIPRERKPVEDFRRYVVISVTGSALIVFDTLFIAPPD
jgi:hypothetical protein